MNDLNMLKDLGATLDPETDGPPPRLRHRVLNSFDGPPPRRRRGRLSWGWSLATSAGLAAVLVVSLMVGLGRSGTRPDGGLTASDVLLRAASFQRTDTTPPPGPDQFVYVQSISAYWNSGLNPPIQPRIREVWLSADGTHDGLLKETVMPGKPAPPDMAVHAQFPGCRNGMRAIVDQHGKVHPDELESCDVYPAYRPEVPTDAEGMLRYLRKENGDRSSDLMFDAAVGVIGEKYVTPGQLAAVFEAISRLPGVVVLPDVVDLAGRHGVAVAMQNSVASSQLIFDPNTYAYLGEQVIALTDTSEHKRGDNLSGGAILAKAIVAQAGGLP